MTQQTLREEIFNILTMNCDNAESIEWRKRVTEAILSAIKRAIPKKENKHKQDCLELRGYKNGVNSAIDDFTKAVE